MGFNTATLTYAVIEKRMKHPARTMTYKPKNSIKSGKSREGNERNKDTTQYTLENIANPAK